MSTERNKETKPAVQVSVQIKEENKEPINNMPDKVVEHKT